MRWANWCEQRDRHFTSGPVEDVVSWAIWLWLSILFPELSYVQISNISSPWNDLWAYSREAPFGGRSVYNKRPL